MARPQTSPIGEVPPHHPGGYPKLGLAPLSLQLSTTSTTKLERQLITHEFARGNTGFTTRNLSKLDIDLANELVSVYLGLAERFPGVPVEYINFSANLYRFKGSTAGLATTRATTIPKLHLQPRATNDDAIVKKIYSTKHQTVMPTRLHHGISPAERLRVLEHNDLSPGRISLATWLGSPRNLTDWATRHEKWQRDRIRVGEPVFEWYPIPVSHPTHTLLHEFGHLVEHSLLRMGPEPYDYVISALEDGFLRNTDGSWLVSDRKLRAAGLTRAETRLHNWPNEEEFSAEAWRKVLRRAISWEMHLAVMISLTPWRSECFAEMFMHSMVHTSPATKARLTPFQEALYDVGISVKRRRKV
jgi:hypothetical protein